MGAVAVVVLKYHLRASSAVASGLERRGTLERLRYAPVVLFAVKRRRF